MYQVLKLLDKIGLRGKPTMIHRYAICMTLCIYSEGVAQITSVYLAYKTGTYSTACMCEPVLGTNSLLVTSYCN